ncbi:hypothetical protein HYW94_02165 [Candidatus Uhrbacteria bacterium]|nr:hypothetical protein [Candidatus Uhrbacteria bacterium]
MKQIQTGLEAYLNDKSEYPGFQGDLGVGAAGARTTNPINKFCDTDDGFQNANCVGTTYMNPVPANPRPGKDDPDQYKYASKDDATPAKDCVANKTCVTYTIVFKLESGSGTFTKGTYQANENGIVRTGDY